MGRSHMHMEIYYYSHKNYVLPDNALIRGTYLVKLRGRLYNATFTVFSASFVTEKEK